MTSLKVTLRHREHPPQVLRCLTDRDTPSVDASIGLVASQGLGP